MSKTSFWATVSTVALFVFIASAANSFASTISGTVYDQRRNGLPYVNVELLNDTYSMLQRAVTDGSGRYTFNGLRDGNYYVKVLPLRYDFEEETHMVEIATVSIGSRNGTGNAFVMEDFYLKPRKGTIAAAQAEVVVAQDIPTEAKRSYEAAVKLVGKGKSDEAIPLLESAITAFPAYFLANHALGEIYFYKNDFGRAAPRFLKAIEAYEKSPTTLYMLGVSFTKLNYLPNAIVAFQAALTLAPESAAIYTALGRAQLKKKDPTAALASLLEAKKRSGTTPVEIFQLLAVAYWDLKQYSKAVANMEAVLKAGNLTDTDRDRLKKEIADLKAKAIQNGEKVDEE